MTTEYSISVEDWSDEKWEMTGRDIMLSQMETEGTPQNKRTKEEYPDDDFETIIHEKADENCPMMNYAYPLYSRPSDEQIIQICEETNCTVVEDTEAGEFYLALTGGGMNLSQDIALAYILAGEHIPSALAGEVSTQEGLSVAGKDWLKVMRECRKSLVICAEGDRRQAKKIMEAMREYRKRKPEKSGP